MKRSHRLCDEDCRAVDLLLDHGNTASQRGVSAAAERVPQRRMAAAQRVMDLIGIMPATEPPDDLLARTMQRVAQAAGKAVRPGTAAGSRPSAQLPSA